MYLCTCIYARISGYHCINRLRCNEDLSGARRTGTSHGLCGLCWQNIFEEWQGRPPPLIRRQQQQQQQLPFTTAGDVAALARVSNSWPEPTNQLTQYGEGTPTGLDGHRHHEAGVSSFRGVQHFRTTTGKDQSKSYNLRKRPFQLNRSHREIFVTFISSALQNQRKKNSACF